MSTDDTTPRLLAENGETWTHPSGWTTVCASDDGARLYDLTPNADTVTPVCFTDDELADVDGIARLQEMANAEDDES